MIITDLARFALVLLLLLPHPPLWLVFIVLVAIGLLAPPFESARSAILPEIVQGEQYMVGNTLINTTLQGAQVAGFFLGGLLVSLVSVRGALAIDAASFLLSAAMLAVAVAERPAPERSGTTLLHEVVAGMRMVRHDATLLGLLVYGLLAAIAAIVPEGLAVAVSGADRAGARDAGILTASLPLGYVVASTVLLRVPVERRVRLMTPLSLLLCLPLLATPLVDGIAPTAVLWFVAGLGTSVQLIASVTYVAHTAPEFRGRAFGIAVTVLMLGQGGALLAAGAMADLAGARNVVAGAAGIVLVALFAARTTLAGAQGSV